MTRSNVTRLHSFYRAALSDECSQLVQFAQHMMITDERLIQKLRQPYQSERQLLYLTRQNQLFRINQLISSLELIAMATKRGTNRAKFDASSYVFVKCELRSEDKADAKEWLAKNTKDLGTKLHDVMASDYKFTCSFSQEHDTFTACLVGKEDNPINGKKTLTARHKDWVAAAMTVLFKHEVMFGSGVWESGVDQEDDGWA